MGNPVSAGVDAIVEDRVVRIAVTVSTAVLVALVGLALPGSATTTKNGLPAYTDGYATWRKLNRRPLTAPGAHTGVKNVYASRPRAAARRFPDGTVIVKSIAAPGARGLARQVAVMRKVRGRWRWVEYQLADGRYGVLASGSLCTSCHMQARASDWVFTRG